MDRLRTLRPPAITTGLVPFYLVLYVLNLRDSLKLESDALFRLNLNMLSFYPLVFFNFLHLLVGVALFTPLCAQFELNNGTVRTGIVLNVTAFLPGVIDNIIVKLSGGRIGTATFCGTSSWMLALAGFLSLNTWSLPVIPVKSLIIGIPAWTLPGLFWVIVCVLAPQYALIHTIAFFFGVFLGTGHLGFLVDGTTKVVAWIESKLERGIALLRYLVRFVGEVEARELRRANAFAARRSSVQADEIPLPAASLTNPSA